MNHTIYGFVTFMVPSQNISAGTFMVPSQNFSAGANCRLLLTTLSCNTNQR